MWTMLWLLLLLTGCGVLGGSAPESHDSDYDLSIIVAESDPPQYFVLVDTTFAECDDIPAHEVTRSGNTITVEFPGQGEERNCFMEISIPLGTDFASGESYTVTAGGVSETFTAQ